MSKSFYKYALLKQIPEGYTALIWAFIQPIWTKLLLTTTSIQMY